MKQKRRGATLHSKKLSTIQAWAIGAGFLMFVSVASGALSHAIQTTNSLALVSTYDRVTGNDPDFVVPGKTRYLRITPPEILADSFTLELPDGETLTFVKDYYAQYPGNGGAWVGHVQDEPQSTAIFGHRGRSLHGSITRDGKSHELIAVSGSVHKLREIDTSKLLPEAELEAPVEDEADTPATDGSLQTAAELAGTPTTIDVMVVYTPAVAAYSGGQSGAEAKIIGAVELANLDYRNSNIPMQVRLVHMEQVDYVESGDMSVSLSNLRGTTDGNIDHVHQLRDTYGADLVAMVTRDGSYCGIGYLTGSAGSPSSGFAIVAPQCLNPNNSLAHEWGHNMGSAHNREQTTSGGVYPYSYGYCNPGQFRTVMSYSCSGERRLNYFSSPDIVINGLPAGVADMSDNARSISAMASVIAKYRPTGATTPPTAPINLSGTPAAATQVNLRWSDTSDNESGFRVERSVNSGSTWTTLTTTVANTSSYTDTSVSAQSTYYYRVAAVNAAGVSAYTNVVMVTTPEQDVTAPSAPTNLGGVAQSSSRIDLTWDAASDNVGVAGYVVYRNGSQVANVTGTAYNDTNLAPATPYTFTVKAYDGSGNYSTESAPATVMTQNAPLAITSSGVGTVSETDATVVWMTNVPSSGSVYFGTSRRGTLDKTVSSASVGTSHSAQLSGLSAGTTYYYKVVTQASNGETAETSVYSFKTPRVSSGGGGRGKK